MKEFETILPLFRAIGGADRAADFTDDVAWLRGGGQRIVTVDALVEGVHFLRSDPVASVARKLVRVNVSDILAKGAIPREALLTLGWPDRLGDADLRDFAAAFGAELTGWDMALVGGDTVRSPDRLFLSLTVMGVPVGAGPVRRSGGRPGHGLWVTGTIGAGHLGLAAALAGDTASPFIARYREPHLPPEGAAHLIADHASASMDVSDGLLGDALKLAEASGCGLSLDLRHVPYAGPAASRADRLAQATGGDDYQSLFALDPSQEAAATAFAEAGGIRITRVGSLGKSGQVSLTDGGEPLPLPPRLSFEHGSE